MDGIYVERERERTFEFSHHVQIIFCASKSQRRRPTDENVSFFFFAFASPQLFLLLFHSVCNKYTPTMTSWLSARWGEGRRLGHIQKKKRRHWASGAELNSIEPVKGHDTLQQRNSTQLFACLRVFFFGDNQKNRRLSLSSDKIKYI